MNNTIQKTNILDDFKTSLDILRDHKKGIYKNFDKNSLIVVILGLLYIISPIDLIPDFLVGGILDDTVVLAYIFKVTSFEITKYKLWKEKEVD